MFRPNYRHIFAPVCALFALALATPPAFAVNKDMVQLQTQVQQLQDAVARLQQSNDERMGVLKDLVQQNADSVNKMSLTVEALQKSLSSQQEANGGKLDQVSGQVQSLNDSLDEVKARLNSLEKALQGVQNQQQSINATLQNLQQQQNPAPGTDATQPGAPSATAQPGAQPSPGNEAAKPSADVPFSSTQGPYANTPSAPVAPSASTAPPSTDLYKTALSDYMAAKYTLSYSEFGQLVHAYPNDPLAGSAYYYLGEIDYRMGKYPAAIKDYDHVIDQFPGNSKIPISHLHKGQALVAMKMRDAGIDEFRMLIQRFPNSPEAALARSRLNGMGVPIGAKRPE
jgi:TolA-binding protein